MESSTTMYICVNQKVSYQKDRNILSANLTRAYTGLNSPDASGIEL